jgi:hypothetical protein
VQGTLSNLNDRRRRSANIQKRRHSGGSHG